MINTISIIVHLSVDSGVYVVHYVHLSIRLMPASSSLSAAVSAAYGISRPMVAACASPSTASACQGVWPSSPDIPGGDRNRPAGLLEVSIRASDTQRFATVLLDATPQIGASEG